MPKPRRQMGRIDHAQVVVRALLSTAAEGEITDADVGRIVARIIKGTPLFSERQALDVERDWMKVLKAEVSARKLADERDARVAVRKRNARRS
jgi:hypothetical protein